MRLLPWRPRVREAVDVDLSPGIDLLDTDDGVTGVVLSVLGTLVLALLLPFVLVAVVFSLELALVLLLVPFVMAGQVLGLRPWVLVLRYVDGTKEYVEVTGTRAMLARRRGLRMRVGTRLA